jgi:hypothetical protein
MKILGSLLTLTLISFAITLNVYLDVISDYINYELNGSITNSLHFTYLLSIFLVITSGMMVHSYIKDDVSATKIISTFISIPLIFLSLSYSQYFVILSDVARNAFEYNITSATSISIFIASSIFLINIVVWRRKKRVWKEGEIAKRVWKLLYTIFCLILLITFNFFALIIAIIAYNICKTSIAENKEVNSSEDKEVNSSEDNIIYDESQKNNDNFSSTLIGKLIQYSLDKIGNNSSENGDFRVINKEYENKNTLKGLINTSVNEGKFKVINKEYKENI